MKVGQGDDWLQQLVWAPIEEQCSSVIYSVKVLFYRIQCTDTIINNTKVNTLSEMTGKSQQQAIFMKT